MSAEKRGMYVAFFQLFLTTGILLAYVVDLGLISGGHWRLMFALVLIPTTVLFFGMLYLPESPRWLWQHGFTDRARQVLLMTHTPQMTAAAIREIDQQSHKDLGSWGELLSGSSRIALWLAVAVAILNQWTGINTFLQYAPSLLKGAGMSSGTQTMQVSVGIPALNLLCTLLALFLVDRVGRRTLLLIGTGGVCVAELFLGAVPHFIHQPASVAWFMLIGFYAFIVFFAVGPGVVVWLVISELFPTRLRGKGIALCLFFNSLAGTLLSTLFLTIQDWLGQSGAYWLCGGFSLCYFLIVYAYLPETRSHSLERIQVDMKQRFRYQIGVDPDDTAGVIV